MIRKVAKRVGIVAAALSALLVSFYVFVAHPNDARLSEAQRALTVHEASNLTRVASLLTMHEALEFTVTAEAKAKSALKDLFPEAIINSRRFATTHEVHVSLGSYPWRLDGRDAWLLPPGGRAKVRWKGDAKVLEFGAAAPRGGRVSTSGALEKAFALTPLPETMSYDGFWRRQVLSFIDADRDEDVAKWTDVRVELSEPERRELTFECEATEQFCLIAEPTIYGKATARPRNVLVVLVDTLRGEAPFLDVAPNMKAFAEGATVFDNAIAPGNMTSPSTNAMLACRRASDLGRLAFAYGINEQLREAFYSSGKQSFPARLTKRGFDSAMIGNVSVISEVYGVGVSHGFAQQIALERDGYDTAETSREVLRWLSQHRDRPFFLYVHFNGPHAPYRAPWRDIKDSFEGAGDLDSYASLLKLLYRGEVSYTDRHFGKIVASLKELGLYDDTMIVLTADHGDQHRIQKFAYNEAGREFEGAFFDHGATLLNDEIRVPLIVKLPGQAGGRVEKSFVETLDIGPTIEEYLGMEVPPDQHCSGVSLYPALIGHDVSPAAKSKVLASEGFRARAIIFDQRYKFIRTYEPTDKLVYGPGRGLGAREQYMVARQLFDLVEDPDEERNIAASRPDLLTEAERRYREVFSVREGYELVVETPTKEPFRVEFDEGSGIALQDEFEGLTLERGGNVVRGEGHARVIIPFRKWRGVPTVTIAGAPVTVTRTAMRLPMEASADELPIERPGVYSLLDMGKSRGAYVRRIEDDGQAHRRIAVGNPKFDRVLREWGYLNDR